MRPGSRSVRVLSVPLGLRESDSNLLALCAQQAGIPSEAILDVRLARRAIDARRRGRKRDLRFIVHADLTLRPDFDSTALARALKSGRVQETPPPVDFQLTESGIDARWREGRVIVVGAGPAGLYAAWTLAHNGIDVDVIDRGPSLRERSRAVARFSRTREVDPERNLLYGEGGAGTYSDGKLYTRTQHALETPILQSLIDAGADPEIAFDARAHVGTDRLHRILPRLRASLEARGVRFHFDTRLEGFEFEGAATPRQIRAVMTSRGEMESSAVVLAVGHSARDTLRELSTIGLPVEAKPFQLGLRIEHPQALIDEGRFGANADLSVLGHAYYGLVAKKDGERGPVHSFCMCPGGQIVAAVSEPGLLCTNGMSNSKHSSPWANSGLVVTLGPREFGEGDFAGVDFQERIEAEFFAAGGSDYSLPAQRVPDFLAGRPTSDPGRSSYKLGLTSTRIDSLLPASMTEALRMGIKRFDGQLAGYASREGLLVGIESRSSGPIRIRRDRVNRRADGFENLFPVGEGAGHAGGIMSAAIDGARSAWALLGHFA